MRNVLSVAGRIIRQVSGDKRTLGLIIVAPIFMITLLWLVINSGATTPNIAVKDLPEQLKTKLATHAILIDVASVDEGVEAIKSKKADAFLDAAVTPPQLTVDGADPAITGLVSRAFQQASMELLVDVPGVGRQIAASTPEIKPLYGSTSSNAFDFIAPVMMGFVIFFFIFILAAIAFLNERVSGTLERMLVSPAKPFALVGGYILGFGFFAVVQTLLIQSFIIFVLGIPTHGGFFAILLVNLGLCYVALSMGSFISAFARSEFQVLQFIPIIILPQVLFSGILDLRAAPQWVQILGDVFPLTYGGRALRDVMLRGHSLVEVGGDVLMVFAFGLLFMILNALALRRKA